jgi:hypothetical protein
MGCPCSFEAIWDMISLLTHSPSEFAHAVAGLIACKDTSLFEAFSCAWSSPAPFYKRLEIERSG